jgi:hypothetical protein
LDFNRAENWAEGVSDFEVWNIGQVTMSNFDWLPFTSLWSPSPVLQICNRLKLLVFSYAFASSPYIHTQKQVRSDSKADELRLRHGSVCLIDEWKPAPI